MREAATRHADLVMWIEPSERNMRTGSHRVMILSVWEQFSIGACNADRILTASIPRRQDCLRHLFCFQRDVTTAALTINAHQNFLVRL
jgi:hypothetical protein